MGLQSRAPLGVGLFLIAPRDDHQLLIRLLAHALLRVFAPLHAAELYTMKPQLSQATSVSVEKISIGLPQFGQIRSSMVGVLGLPWQPSMIMLIIPFLSNC